MQTWARRTQRLILTLTLCTSGVAGAQPAVENPVENPADPVADAAGRGERAFQAGRYQAAIDAYVEAYQLEPVSALLFNVAFIYDEHLRNPRLARAFYRRYVDEPDADPKARLKAYKRITALDEQLLREHAEAQTPVPVPVTPPPAPAIEEKIEPVAPAESATLSTQSTVGYVALGTGGAAIVTGLILAAVTASTADDFDQATDVFDRRELGDQGRSQAIAADVSLGLGVAIAAAGAWLVLTDDTPAPTPTVTEGGAGLSWGFTF